MTYFNISEEQREIIKDQYFIIDEKNIAYDEGEIVTKDELDDHFRNTYGKQMFEVTWNDFVTNCDEKNDAKQIAGLKDSMSDELFNAFASGASIVHRYTEDFNHEYWDFDHHFLPNEGDNNDFDKWLINGLKEVGVFLIPALDIFDGKARYETEEQKAFAERVAVSVIKEIGI